MTPELSVVVPTYDTRELTLRCCAAIEAASAAPSRSGPVELVVVDDGGSDGTSDAVAAAFPGAKVLRLSRNSGFTVAANHGLRAATGRILVLLNSDTEVEPGGLAALVEAFAASPRLGVAGARLLYPDGTAQWSAGRTPDAAWMLAAASGLPALLARLPLYRRARRVESERETAAISWVTGAALAMRREVWESAGPFDEGFRLYAQDLDLCLRAGALGFGVAVVPGFRLVHHHGATVARDLPLRLDPELFFSDLLRWARKHGGLRFEARLRRATRVGLRLRVFGRRVAALTMGRERRSAFGRETALWERALARASMPDPE
jgi:GT2 family glycosyltransferase